MEAECTVCKELGELQLLQKVNVVLAALQAHIDLDADTLKTIHDTAEPGDAHVAIAVAFELLSVLAALGFDVRRFVKQQREAIGARVAASLGQDPGGPNPVGVGS